MVPGFHLPTLGDQMSKACMVLGWALLTSISLAQDADSNPAPDARHQQIFVNGLQVKLNVTLDRQTYLPGESVWVTISATNPLTTGIEIFDPQISTGLDLDRWGDSEQTGTLHW